MPAPHAESKESWSAFLKGLRDLPRAPDEPDIDLAEVAREGRRPNVRIDPWYEA
jgi:hypothetical protein